MDNITHNPNDLRPHPLNRLPRWERGSEHWLAFLEDIRTNGIKNPVRITESLLVVDGETRRQAALALHLETIECVVVSEAEARDIILRELSLRRNLTKGQIAYIASDLLGPEFEAGDRNRTARFTKGNGADVAERAAERFGVSRRLIVQARQLRVWFAEVPELREQFEAQIMDLDAPIGLGAAVAGAGALMAQIEAAAKGRPHGGGRPADVARQLELFTLTFKRDLIARVEYWAKWDDGTRATAIESIAPAFQQMPEELLRQLDRKIAAELRNRAQ